MPKIIRLLLYFLLFLLWVAVMVFPFFALTLSQQGEMTIGDTRIFLVDERDGSGIGFQSSVAVNNESACTLTRINYLMWEGENDSAENCSCADGIARLPKQGACVAR